MKAQTQQTPEEVFDVFGPDAAEPVKHNLDEQCRFWLAKKRDIDEIANIIPRLPVVSDHISLRGLYEVMLPKMQHELYSIERKIKWLQKYYDLMHQSTHFQTRINHSRLDAKEIKARVNILDVVREEVELKPSGRSMKGRCPFHNDRSPSFHVYTDSQSWWCYACSEGGDVFSFVQKLHGYDFKTALSVIQAL